MSGRKPTIAVGAIVKVPESDYCYGTGDLILRVSEIGTIEQHDNEAWLTLRGVQLRSNGAEFGERTVLVRVSALVPSYRRKTQP